MPELAPPSADRDDREPQRVEESGSEWGPESQAGPKPPEPLEPPEPPVGWPASRPSFPGTPPESRRRRMPVQAGVSSTVRRARSTFRAWTFAA